MRLVLILSLLFANWVIAAADNAPITGDIRNSLLERGQIWRPVNIPKMNILSGPKNPLARTPGSLVTCRYIEPKEPPAGTVPKFKCTVLKSGEEIRVKYGDNTREVFAEVAASRLLWALGFYTDEDYYVRIKCLGCPEKNPFRPEKDERRITRIFDSAMLERTFPGVIVEASEDQGWSWNELDKVDEKKGGATRAQKDAFRLLAVFIQHSDNKAVNQRLVCYKQDLPDPKNAASCRRPILMIADLGATFGAGATKITDTAKMDFQNWKNKDVWNLTKEHDYLVQHGQQICIGNLPNTIKAAGEGLFDPEISEEGRKMLADLLNQLSLKQIRDVFRAAGVDKMDEYINDAGTKRKVTVEDWVAAFVKKRAQLDERRCPPLP
jgi:hypothetical protein